MWLDLRYAPRYVPSLAILVRHLKIEKASRTVWGIAIGTYLIHYLINSIYLINVFPIKQCFGFVKAYTILRKDNSIASYLNIITWHSFDYANIISLDNRYIFGFMKSIICIIQHQVTLSLRNSQHISSTLKLHSVWSNNIQNIILFTAPCDTVVTHITIKSMA